ncbi:MAG: hypothetical protein PHZ02_01575 [Desulfocapsaceae bacterium]|nr:hypothetical protein [Desulfocapsaceae bacterium]
METDKVSEIEKIIKKEIEDETNRKIEKIQAMIDSETKEAVGRINGVYNSAINTLRMLELADASLFDFFQKTNGNIRVIEFKNQYDTSLDIRNSGIPILNYQTSIHLKENTIYKLIVLAIEIKEDGAGTKG